MDRLPYTYGKCVAATADNFTIQFDPAVYPFLAPIPAYLTRVQAVMQVILLFAGERKMVQLKWIDDEKDHGGLKYPDLPTMSS